MLWFRGLTWFVLVAFLLYSLTIFLITSGTIATVPSQEEILSTDGEDILSPSRSTLPLCDTLVTGEGAWVEAAFLEKSCARQSLASLNVATCLRNRTILFYGHSHLRYVVVELLRHLGANTTELELARHDHHTFFVANITVVFVFTASGASIKGEWKYYGTYDYVFLANGVWQMLFSDFDPTTTTTHLTAGFHKASKHFKSKMYIVMNLHYMHEHTNTTDPRHEYLRICASDPRQRAYRQMITCATRNALPGAFVLDVRTLTQGAFAKRYAATDGHHYGIRSPVMSETLRVIFHGLCHVPALLKQGLAPLENTTKAKWLTRVAGPLGT